MKISRLLILLGILALTTTAHAGAIDLDRGHEGVENPNPALPDARDDCYLFGGNSQSYTNPFVGRGNTITVISEEILSMFTMELGFTGEVDLFFYVLHCETLGGAYTVAAESVVTTTGVGQAFYESGPINVVLLPGHFYGIGVAWQDAQVTYVRDPASLPRAWELGTVEDAMQIGDPPPYSSVAYNHFTGAEYSLEICFTGPVSTDSFTWTAVKALYR